MKLFAIHNACIVACLSFVAPSGLCLAGSPFTIIEVARTDDEPPGRIGATFTDFNNASINSSGEVVFEALYTGVSSGNEGIYRFANNTLSRALDNGFNFHPPGQGGATSWSGFGAPVINAAGHIAFGGNYSFGDGNLGLFIMDENNVVDVVIDNNPATPVPGQPTAIGFSTFPFSSGVLAYLSDSGHSSVVAEFVDSAFAFHDGLYAGAVPAAPRRAADDTQTPPGQAPPAQFTSFDFFMALCPDGDVVMRGQYNGGVGSSGIYRYDRSADVLLTIADGLVSLPSTQPPTASFLSVDPFPSAGPNGMIAFGATYTGGIGSRGIFRSDSTGTLETIVHNGVGSFAVPDNPGKSFTVFGTPVMNQAGDVLFFAEFGAGPDDAGLFLWREAQSDFVKVVDLSDPVPGQPGASFFLFSSAFLNAQGHVTVAGRYTSGVGNEGIYFFDGVALGLITDESLPLNGATPSNVDLFLGANGSGGADGKPSSISNNDQIVFIATFPDGSEGVYLASPPPCPADLNGDGAVGSGDFAIMLGSWGTAFADLDGDSIVGSADLALLLGAWGPCP